MIEYIKTIYCDVSLQDWTDTEADSLNSKCASGSEFYKMGEPTADTHDIKNKSKQKSHDSGIFEKVTKCCLLLFEGFTHPCIMVAKGLHVCMFHSIYLLLTNTFTVLYMKFMIGKFKKSEICNPTLVKMSFVHFFPTEKGKKKRKPQLCCLCM